MVTSTFPLFHSNRTIKKSYLFFLKSISKMREVGMNRRAITLIGYSDPRKRCMPQTFTKRMESEFTSRYVVLRAFKERKPNTTKCFRLIQCYCSVKRKSERFIFTSDRTTIRNRFLSLTDSNQ